MNETPTGTPSEAPVEMPTETSTEAPVEASIETPTGTRRAPMLWGQEHYWFLYFDVPSYGATRDCVKITRSWRLDAPVPDDAVLASLSTLVRRYESLRTRFLHDDTGRPVQEVDPPWTAAFELSTVGGASDVPAVAERLAARPFDPARDRPVRFALVREEDGSAWVVVTAIHSAIDGQSWMALERAFLGLVGARPDDVPQPEARQPREQAELDHSAARSRYRERVRTYWQDRYRSIPQGMFPDYRPAPVGHFDGFAPPSPYERVTLRSRRLAFAAERVAAAHKVAPGVVYLAAYGAALSALSGNDRCVVSMDTANRADPMLSAAVGCFFQPALVVFDVAAGDSSATLLTKVFRAVLTAQRFARYSSLEMTEERAGAGHERGMNLRIGVTYNYFARARPEHADADEDLRTGTGTEDFVVEKAPIDWQDNSADLYLAVETGEDGVTLSMHGHTSVTDGERIARALHGIGALVTGWADGTIALDTPVHQLLEQLGLLRRRFGEGWVQVDHAWVDTRACAALIAGLPGVTAAEVFAAPHRDRDRGAGSRRTGHDLAAEEQQPPTSPPAKRLIAHVSGETTPQTLRTQLASALADHPSLVLPHWFVVRRDAPEGTTPQAWAAAPVTAEGDGFPSRPEPPRTPQERALADALAARCPCLVADMATPYLPAGGRTSLAPLVVDHLSAAGFAGIIPADLLGPLPLRAVAAKLSPTARPRD
ncbi:condensation domain-containing protein [Streptomyces sp. NPDC048442]|uniref:condensation domain-containing protein n=1 Tax=Streptomyces sp. NPDC048442 TaxID=3154823 RepID=UPI0034389DC1